ncbi:hypothetical protein C2G38_2211142 [Gigaspora rosea]|uniref:Uncharacterized protein n=1 Tax=Gigaspora rosea TaxID=44941 RepID=A0A397UNE4_9GLOM|nr:hypothetical protein C2G38_2211142 [Gigaspora rosea]
MTKLLFETKTEELYNEERTLKLKVTLSTPMAKITYSEQSEELQKIINKNICGPLYDEQIPAALDFILEVLEYVITKDKKDPRQEDKKYSGRPDVRYYKAEIKKVKQKTFKHYQKPANRYHTYETDDSYDTDWYCRNNGELELIKKRRLRNPNTISKSHQSKYLHENEEEERITQKEEITSEVDAVLEPGNLALNLIEGTYKEDLTKEKPEKEENQTFKTY